MWGFLVVVAGGFIVWLHVSLMPGAMTFCIAANTLLITHITRPRRYLVAECVEQANLLLYRISNHALPLRALESRQSTCTYLAFIIHRGTMYGLGGS